MDDKFRVGILKLDDGGWKRKDVEFDIGRIDGLKRNFQWGLIDSSI